MSSPAEQPDRPVRRGLLWKTLLAFVVFPGIVAITVPVLLGRRVGVAHPHLLGAVPLVFGLALLLWCVREFYVAGRGTLAPWSPPTHLVTTGPYRHSRNPMYVAVFSMLVGWAILFGSWSVAIYAVVVLAVFHLRVVFGEEPWLARTFPDDWNEYRQRVPRWLIFSVRRGPPSGDGSGS